MEHGLSEEAEYKKGMSSILKCELGEKTVDFKKIHKEMWIMENKRQLKNPCAYV